MPIEKNSLVAWIATAVMAVAFSTAVVLVAWTRPGGGISTGTGQVTPEGLSSTGEGRVSATPDQAEVTLGVEARNADAAKASDESNVKANAIIEAIKGLGVRDAEIQTVNVGVFPEYNFSPTGGTSEVTGYIATNNVVVKTKTVGKVSDMVDVAVEAGANLVQGVNFSFTDETKRELEDQARRAALEDARTKAEVTAQVSNVQLGKVISINETSSPVYPMFAEAGLGAGGGDVAKSTPVEPGTSEIFISVIVTYEIE